MAHLHAALSEVLSHPAIWRGGDCASETAALPTGYPALDGVLPGGGWPQGALTEILLEREGIGELRLTLPGLARLTREGRAVVWIAPPYRPYAPALAATGLDLARLIVVRGRTLRDSLWAYEQALRAADCGAAFAWLDVHEPRVLRRLQVAAREGRTWGVLWRRPGQRGSAAAAPLRLGLAPHEGRLAVHVLKRRGAELTRPVVIDVTRMPGAPLIAPLAVPESRLRPPPHLASRPASRPAPRSATRPVAPLCEPPPRAGSQGAAQDLPSRPSTSFRETA